jgi:hypothetical protein
MRIPREEGKLVDLLQVSLSVDPAGSDEHRVAEDVISLARELRQADIHSVEPASDASSPAGTRGVDMVSAGSLIVLAAGSRVLLRSVLDIVQDWLARRQSGMVSVKIDNDELIVTYASKSEITKAVDAFVARHAK